MAKASPLNFTEVDPTDACVREAQAFPRLIDERSRQVAAFGIEEEVGDRDLSFARGQRSIDVFLVTNGAVETFDTDARGVAHLNTTQRAGRFTGEMDRVNDRLILVTARCQATR